ncbi:ATP synthase F0 subunit B [Allobaculum sp. Allo2]|uniref:ATP synthase F0 subunit B n=1 Tax=Allobaculum sp. Allo2 TaxID=2853432 RepID=UPI001F61EBC0|nr:hypothetical protein [Allobaculum sp. Allo2]
MIDFNIDNYLRISWQDVLLVCISSLIIVLFCKHFFWDKILAFINKRQKLIQDNIDSSETLKKKRFRKRKNTTVSSLLRAAVPMKSLTRQDAKRWWKRIRFWIRHRNRLPT